MNRRYRAKTHQVAHDKIKRKEDFFIFSRRIVHRIVPLASKRYWSMQLSSSDKIFDLIEHQPQPSYRNFLVSLNQTLNAFRLMGVDWSGPHLKFYFVISFGVQRN